MPDLEDCQSKLNELLARMVDHYDGAPDSDNRVPFTGSDIKDLEELTR